MMEASLDPLVTISPEGKITDVNEATTRITGVAREHLIGTDFSDLLHRADRAREGYRQVFARGLRRRLPADLQQTGGDLVQVLFTAPVYKDAASNVLGVLAVPAAPPIRNSNCESFLTPGRSWTIFCRVPQSTRSSGWT